MNRFILRGFSAFAFAWFGLCFSVVAFGETEKDQGADVLILHSYHKTDWTDDVFEGVRSVLGDCPRVDFYVEYMDTKTVYDREYLDLLACVYQRKYGNRSFDLILTSDDNAFRFVLDRGKSLFNGAPTVFCGVNRFDPGLLEGHPEATGVLESGDFRDTLAFAFEAFPNPERIFIIGDDTVTCRVNREHMLRVLEENWPDVEHEMLDRLTVAELAEKLQTAPRNSFAFILSFWFDSEGRTVTPEALGRLLKKSAIPIFGRSDWMIGRGIIGGKCVSGVAQGRAAAQLGLQILQGRPTSEIPMVIDSPNRFLFEHSELAKWGVPESRLPEGSVVMNRPEGFYRVPKNAAALLGASLILLALLSALLLHLIFRLRRTNRALAGSEKRLRTIFEEGGDAVSVHRLDGRFIDVNERICDSLQYTREELLGLRAWDVEVGFGSPERFHRLFEKLQTEGGQTRQGVHRRKDGTTFPVEVRVASIELDGETCILALVRDISERVKAAEALEYRNRFEAVIAEISARFINIPLDRIDQHLELALEEVCLFAGVDGAFLALFSDDRKGFAVCHEWRAVGSFPEKARFRALDPARMPWWMSRILGCQTVAASSLDAFPEKAREEREAFEEKGVRAVVGVPLTLGGETFGFLALAAAFAPREWTEDEISLMHMVGEVLANAIARKRTEEENRGLESLLRQAQKMEAVGQLAGGIAHDFNNILQAIQGYIDLCLLDTEGRGSHHEYLSEVSRASARAADLVRQLLTFSRRETLSLEPVDLNEAVSRIAGMLLRLIGEHIRLDLAPAAEKPVVAADPGQIEQLVVNLCLNSRDAMPEGGTITVATGNVSFDEAFCRENPWARPGEFVVLSVADSGAGIPVEIQDRIFEPFFTTKDIGKGTGLGLATVYAVVERNRGFLRVSSAVGKGTTFYVHLPIKAVSVSEPVAADPVVPAPGAGSGTILLAEDDDSVRNLAHRILKSKGFRVLEARDGREAHAVFERCREEIDIAVLDIVMPYRSGLDLLRAFRDCGSAIPVLLCTGYGYDVIGRRDDGLDGYQILQKPYSPFTLLRKIHEMKQ